MSGDDWGVWIVYSYDMTTHVDAIYPNEIDALRHAVGSGYQKVQRITAGDIREQIQ